MTRCVPRIRINRLKLYANMQAHLSTHARECLGQDTKCRDPSIKVQARLTVSTLWQNSLIFVPKSFDQWSIRRMLHCNRHAHNVYYVK